MLTRAAVAKKLGKSIATVRRMEGVELHPVRDERGHHRFDPAEVEAVARRKRRRLPSSSRRPSFLPIAARLPPSALRAYLLSPEAAADLGDDSGDINWQKELTDQGPNHRKNPVPAELEGALTKWAGVLPRCTGRAAAESEVIDEALRVDVLSLLDDCTALELRELLAEPSVDGLIKMALEID